MPPDLAGLRLLIVGDWPPPLGGVSVHVRSLRNAAMKAGARVTVLDLNRGRAPAQDDLVSVRNEADFLVSLATLAALHDIVHLHTSGANIKSWALVFTTGVVSKAMGADPMLTLHSGHGPRWLTTSPRVLGARTALAPYTRLVCVSDEIARQMTRMGVYGRRGLVAPAFGHDGLELAPLPPAVSRVRASHDVVVSAMLGRGEDYGGSELIQAFLKFRKHAPNAALVLYGPGATEALLTDRPGLRNTPIWCLGPIDRGEALAVVQASDLFVRPTRVDGDAVSVREALALGTPAVATRVGTRPAAVTLCEPGDAKDLERAMRLALASPPHQEEMHDGIQQVLSTYARVRGGETTRQATGGLR